MVAEQLEHCRDGGQHRSAPDDIDVVFYVDIGGAAVDNGTVQMLAAM